MSKREGLKEKYHISRLDDKPIKGGMGIVLEVGDPNSWAALRTWSNTVRDNGYTALANDIDDLLEEHMYNGLSMLDFLKLYNKWRRGADIPQPDPVKIGVALDWAISQIEGPDLNEALEIAVDYIEDYIEQGCVNCGGDCSSANPPVASCLMRKAEEDLNKVKIALLKLKECN